MDPEGVLFLWTVMFGMWREVCPWPLSISVPNRVLALSGSCVVIPCSFTGQTASSVGRRPAPYHVRLRYESGLFSFSKTAFSSEDVTRVHKDFRGRVALIGDLSRSDCSVRIEAARKEDTTFYEVGLKKRGMTIWKKSLQVNLEVSDVPKKPVISEPGAVIEGQLVTLNCSANYSCPDQPPQLKLWWERGAQDNCSVSNVPGLLLPHGQEQVVLASLTFKASHLAPPKVKCVAEYPSGQTVTATKDLRVKFPPRNVTVYVHTLTVQDGGSVLMSCSCKADPPALEYHWSYSQQGRTTTLPQNLHTVRVYNVTRDLRVRCSARNQIGVAESSPTAINVLYKPIISQGSSCQWDGWSVLCRCTVDSNPRAAVTWSVNGSAPSDGFNTSASVWGTAQTAVLSGKMDIPLAIVCYAYNMLGNDSHTLLGQGHSEHALLWKVVPAVGILLALFLLSFLLLFLRCHRKTGKHVLNYRPSSVYPGFYQERAPLYINCTEVTHLYTNGSYQLVYQNCTPVFIRDTQWRRQRERRVAWSDSTQRERRSPESDPVYLEII